MINLEQITRFLSLPKMKNVSVNGFSIDSRHIQPGELFVAIKGEVFDGHEYIVEAARKGAVAVLCEQAVDGLSIPQIVVKDTLQSLAEIAKHYRSQFHCPVIALTGSNGKTTVKEMISSILPSPSLATKGNLNNHIGVPLSVLKLEELHRYAVFELGANHPGEIAYTVNIAQPDVALINNIAPAHIEGFGSIEGVAQTKGEIYQGLKEEGWAIVNDDDSYAHYWDSLIQDKNVLRFSALHKADIYADNCMINDQGLAKFILKLPKEQIELQLQVPGSHNIYNALAAASCCYAVGIPIEDIKKGLEQFTGVKGRMTLLKGKSGSTIIDDSYNANLRSVLSALEWLSTRKGKKIFVFGDMGELGPYSEKHHREVGAVAAKKGIDILFTYGTNSKLTSESFGKNAHHFSDQQSLIKEVLSEIDDQTTILVKGSRSSSMENVVGHLLETREPVCDDNQI